MECALTAPPPTRHTGEACDGALAVSAALFDAMLDVPWGPSGLPEGVDEGGEYGRLAATPRGEAVQRCMGGVEAVDDVIGRGEFGVGWGGRAPWRMGVEWAVQGGGAWCVRM